MRNRPTPVLLASSVLLSSVLLSSVLAGCSDSKSTASSSTSSTTTTVEPTTGTGSTGTGSAGSDGTNTFVIPQELLDRVANSGLTTVDVDYPPQPETVDWPTTNWVRADLPSGVDASTVNSIVDTAFTGGGDGDVIDAILVVQGGKLVLERYNGWDPQARHNSWSMAKSMTQAMVGILERDNKIDVFQPAQAAEWADPADPRHNITVDQLLRMSSGLEWEESYADADGDVLTVLGERGKADRAGYTARKPLEAEPDTKFEYSTGTADIIGREVGQIVGLGAPYEAWIQKELFDPLGIPGADHQFDETGNTNSGSWINLRPEDFARFGLLFLRDGVWDGTRILPEGWVDYSRLPTPTSPQREYGAQWWLHGNPAYPEVFWASGFNGQSITVMPKQDTVIVVLSTTSTDRDSKARDALMDAFAGLAR